MAESPRGPGDSGKISSPGGLPRQPQTTRHLCGCLPATMAA